MYNFRASRVTDCWIGSFLDNFAESYFLIFPVGDSLPTFFPQEPVLLQESREGTLQGQPPGLHWRLAFALWDHLWHLLAPAQVSRHDRAKKLRMKGGNTEEASFLHVCMRERERERERERGCESGTGFRMIHLYRRRASFISKDHQSGYFHRHLIPLRARQIFYHSFKYVIYIYIRFGFKTWKPGNLSSGLNSLCKQVWGRANDMNYTHHYLKTHCSELA